MSNNKEDSDNTTQDGHSLIAPEQDSKDSSSTVHLAGFSSPLPPPTILEQYERVHSGAIEWILKTTSEETAHRRKLEEKALEAEIESMRSRSLEVKRGQIFGFCIGLFTIAVGAYTAMSGAELAGGFIGTGGVVALVSVFLFSKQAK